MIDILLNELFELLKIFINAQNFDEVGQFYQPKLEFLILILKQVTHFY